MICSPHILGSAGIFSQHMGWVAAAAAMLLAIAMGWSDVVRFRLRRIWALSDTCFTEAIRRRVLLVTPLAIIGLIVVVQLQEPADQQDAIRQTTKFCLFASGLLVTVTALILACTNLPREIESRVIYTIVTKPTTRLEVVLGKVVGFTRVSGLIILIMGLFTFVYLELRNWHMVRGVEARLRDEAPDSPEHMALAHWANVGFLDTKSLDFPQDLGFYSRVPANDGKQWMAGAKSQYFLVQFDPSEDQRGLLAAAVEKNADVDLLVTLDLVRHKPSDEELKSIRELGITPQQPASQKPFALGPELPSTAPPAPANVEAPAQIKVRFLDSEHRPIVAFEEIDAGASGLTVKPSVDGRPGLVLKLSDNVVQRLVHAPAFYVEISGVTPAVEFGAGEMPVVLFVPAGNQGAGAMIQPKFSDGRPVVPRFLARSVRKGMLLMGDANGAGTVAVYRFRGAHVDHGAGGNAAFQLKPWFERNGDFQGADTGFSVVSLEILNRKNNRSSGVLRLTPEMDRTTYIDLPADELAGGDFDVILQDLTPNQWLGIEPTSLALVTADRSFAFNLFKSLFVLWMLSVLVVVISVFCSTFLSWPIAIVLTLVILLGRWGVDQLGDALNPGVGRLVAGDFRVNDPGTSRVVSTSVEGLAKALKDLAAVLPDVSRFPVSEDIERGISVPAAKITGAMEVLLIYGLILVSMSYLILKRKEVAP